MRLFNFLEKEGYFVSLVMKDLDIDEIIEC